MRVGVVDGELAGVLACLPATWTLPGPSVVSAGAVTGVAVTPTMRRRGVLRALVTDAVAAARGRGEVALVLHASEAGIYGRFGFGPASYAATYRLTSPARLRPAPAPAGAVRLLRRDEALEAFPLVFDAHRRTRAGEIDRPEGWWPGFLAEPDEASGRSRFFCAYVAAGQIDGYGVYEVLRPPVGDDLARLDAGYSRRELRIVELVALSDDAYRALWSFLCGIDLVGEITTGPRPLDEPLRHLLADPRALRTAAVADRTWCRLIDAPAALAARRYGGADQLVLEVRDELCPWNAGRYLLAVDEAGDALVAPSAAPAACVLGIDALASLLCGALSAPTLATAGALVARDAAALATLQRLFALAPEPFCTAGF